MTWNVVCLAGANDKYVPPGVSSDSLLMVPIGIADHLDRFQSNVLEEFARFGVSPPVAAWDLLYATVAAYTADVRLPRRSGYDGWTRDITLHLAVEEPDGWGTGSAIFEQMLSFLTGDRWSVRVRSVPAGYVRPRGAQRQQQQVTAHTVSLFSGGLDSFIGAVDLLEANEEQVAFLGHHSRGAGPTSTSQHRAYAALKKCYSEARMPFLHVWLSPPKGKHRASEITTRGRSILFLGLGIAAASGLEQCRLVVPENGVISLNVPLTDARLGSFSTRTTHPYLMFLVRQLLQALGIPITLDLPYRFRTKGEMIFGCSNPLSLSEGLAATMSCARPGASRFSVARDPNLHCGYCLPCLIRRASIVSAVQQDPTAYYIHDLHGTLSSARQSDVRALKLALDRYAGRPPRMADILLPGPLPGTDDDMAAYLSMFRRGIGELDTFMRRAT